MFFFNDRTLTCANQELSFNLFINCDCVRYEFTEDGLIRRSSKSCWTGIQTAHCPRFQEPHRLVPVHLFSRKAAATSLWVPGIQKHPGTFAFTLLRAPTKMSAFVGPIGPRIKPVSRQPDRRYQRRLGCVGFIRFRPPSSRQLQFLLVWK